MSTTERIIVVGGGVIGLSVAWRLARAGASVTVLDRGTPGRGAAWVAGGMVGAVAESSFENDPLVAYARESLARFPSFIEELVADSGMSVPLDLGGILVTVLHADDAPEVRRVYEHRRDAGLPVEWLTGAEVREREPMLSPRVRAAMWMPGEGQVEHRAMLTALVAACRNAGATVRADAAVGGMRVSGGSVTGVVAGDEEIAGDRVVLCAGAWSGGIEGVPPSCVGTLHPVKGQIIALRADVRYPISRVVRTRGAYIVPKADGRVLVGATQEDMGFDVTPTAGPVMELLAHAWEALPCIYELPIDAVEAGLRPGTHDHMPLFGPTEVDGLFACTGHFRHGILLAPATADDACDAIVGGTMPERCARFSPERFSARAKSKGSTS